MNGMCVGLLLFYDGMCRCIENRHYNVGTLAGLLTTFVAMKLNKMCCIICLHMMI